MDTLSGAVVVVLASFSLLLTCAILLLTSHNKGTNNRRNRQHYDDPRSVERDEQLAHDARNVELFHSRTVILSLNSFRIQKKWYVGVCLRARAHAFAFCLSVSLSLLRTVWNRVFV